MSSPVFSTGDWNRESYCEPSVAAGALDEAKRLFDQAKDKSPGEVLDWAREDIQRRGDWEYRIETLADLDAEGLQTRLNALGEDRWEAFWVKEDTGSLTIFLKRPAFSVLRSIPVGEIGSAVSGEGQ